MNPIRQVSSPHQSAAPARRLRLRTEVTGMQSLDTPRTQAIYFDVGETLIRPCRPYGELLQEVAQEAQIELPIGARDGFAAWIDARITERSRQKLPFTFPAGESQRFWLETYHVFLAGFVAETEANRLAHALLSRLSSPEGYELFEDVTATLVHLRRIGYRLGIISNWEAWLPTLLISVGIADLFDHVVISGVCGLEKPDARIFERALHEGGYRPEEVLYVGDRPSHDVEPARKAGMRPILLDREHRYQQESWCQRISSLRELHLAAHTPAARR